jgi:chemosensory pili system protein ChpA (sensor histidine kinase/response regulator)
MQATTPPLETIDDLSALAWVQEELRRSLDTAHKALRRYLKEAEALAGSDVDNVDPGVLRPARAQLHQGVGALELVGLPAAAQVLRAAESALARLAGGKGGAKLDAAAVEAIEQGSFALLDYLQRMLAGKPVSPLALFPQYRRLQTLAGADRVHPADLWTHDWRWRDLPPDASASPPPPGADMRAEVEAQTLALMRDPGGPAAQHLSDLFAALGAAAAGQHRLATFWQLAAAFFEAQARGLLRPDTYSKRMASRLLAVLRLGERGVLDASDRLAQDLLFFCGQAASPGDGRGAPRLAAVRLAYGLAHAAPVDYESPRLGRFNPAWVTQAKKRVAAAKDSWSAVAGGEMLRLPGLNEQFVLVGDSITRLYPQGAPLAEALQRAAAQTMHAGEAPPPALAMEVATSLLYLDASLDDADFEHPQQAQRVQRLAERLRQVAGGGAAEPLEAWMEDLYRRVSDRQTMGSVVHELRSSLSEAEKAIDQYFREPTRTELLVPVPAQLQAMRGVLSVLGLDDASAAVLHMRDEVDALMHGAGSAPAPETAFDHLAGNLGALGFLIDMLSVQPQMAKALFSYDAASGRLQSVVGGGAHRASGFGALDSASAGVAPRLIEQAQSLAFAAARPDVTTDEVRRDLERLSQEAVAADQPQLADAARDAQTALQAAGDGVAAQAAREDLAHQMAEFVATATGALTPLFDEPQARAPVPPPPAVPPAPGATGLEDDAEMRAIFLEEAREVLAGAGSALDALADEPDDVGELTTVRRAFHTLKGSSRMVGLAAFGEAAWACEQLYNARLADGGGADGMLLAATRDMLAYLADWVQAIADGRDGGHDSAAVVRAADAMRLAQRREPLPLPGAAAGVGSEPAPSMIALAEQVPGLPSADALELSPFEATAILPGATGAANDAITPLQINLAALEGEAEEAPAPVAATPAFEPTARAGFASSTIGLISLDLPPSSLMPPPADMAEPVAPAAAEPVAEAPPADAGLPAGEVVAEQAAEPLAEPARDDGRDEPSDLPADDTPMAAPANDADQYRQVGPLAVPIALFNIYLNEADELSRRLGVELAEWALELHRPVGEAAVALAHSLAGSSATVGYADLSQLARALEQALARSHARGGGDADEARLFVDVADEVRRLLHQFAAGFLREPSPALLERLAAHETLLATRAQTLSEAPEFVASSRSSGFGGLGDSSWQPLDDAPPASAARAERPPVHASADALDDEDDVDAVNAIDPDLWPFFEEEGAELLPQLTGALRDWAAEPASTQASAACMRTLHTLKGGARLAGAMRLGELAHRLETAIEHLLAREHASSADIEALLGRADALAGHFEQLRAGGMSDVPPPAAAAQPAPAAVQAPPAEPPAPAAGPRIALPLPSHPAALGEEPAPAAPAPLVAQDLPADAPAVPAQPEPAPLAAAAAPAAAPGAAIDWSRFGAATHSVTAAGAERPGAAAGTHAAVRVRAPLLDRLVNHAGEVSITRARIESDVGLLKGSLDDLTDNLERLRSQLRDLELQAETQIASRIEAAKAEGQGFDPLEMDRFTRFQELTRMMAESVNDVATVQRSLQRTLQSAEDELAAQARLTRDMQDDLLRTRMVEFESLSERLYRVVRQAAKETGKQVRLDLVGGSIEIDRGVLDRMTGAFEHLLRNSVTHGIEPAALRAERGKDTHGQITVTLTQEGNEVGVEFRDDGGGLDLPRIRARAVAMGLLAEGAPAGDAELSQLIFHPGMSTAETVTELAGRGIGMDVVRNEVLAMGGRIETASAPGRGTSFKLVLPLTTAVTQVVMLRAGELQVAVPSTLVETVKRGDPAALARAARSGSIEHDGQTLPFFWLGALLDASAASVEPPARTQPLVIVKSAQQRIAVQVDEVLGNQEVVVKHLGAQLSRLPGLAGMTLLPSGRPALIYNPVALAALYGDRAQARTREALAAPHAPQADAAPAALAPLVLVVDDSLTVRRITQRLLEREGYRVAVAKDGIDGLEKLAAERPAVLLSDIEMPRMDGFDLVRNLRADPKLADLPVVMITSRIAQKHRDVAATLGVNHYLGKPYAEDELLGLVQRYAAASAPVPA